MSRGSQSCCRLAAYRTPSRTPRRPGRVGPAYLARPDDDQGGHDGQIGHGVHPEAHCRSHRHDQHAGQGGADDAGAVDHHPVETDGAGQVVGRHQAADEGLSGRRIGDLDNTSTHTDGHQRRHVGRARRRQPPQQRGKQAIERLRDDEEFAQVHPVGHGPAPRAEHQRRDPARGQDQTEIARGTGELEDQPPNGRLLQEAAAGRNNLASEVKAERPGP